MSDPFGNLPVEIRLEILKTLPDLSSLYCATQASPNLRLTFEAYPVKTAGTIMSTLTLELRQLMCAVATSQSESPPSYLLDGDLYANDEEGNIVDIDEEFGNPLPRALSFSTVEALVQTSRNIDIITKEFLDTHIDQLNHMESEHQGKERKPENKWEHVFPARTIPCEMTKTGRASWVERYRVTRALWLIRLFWDSEGVVQGWLSIIMFNKSLDAMEQLMEQPINARFWSKATTWEHDEAQCIMNFLMEKKHLQVALTTGPNRPNEFFFPMGLSTSLDASGQDGPLSEFDPNKSPSIWSQDRQAAKRASNGHAWVHHNTGPRPFNDVGWRTFRRLGFGIGDLKRMYTMELMKLPRTDPSFCDCGLTSHDIGKEFTWRNIRVFGNRIISENPNTIPTSWDDHHRKDDWFDQESIQIW